MAAAARAVEKQPSSREAGLALRQALSDFVPGACDPGLAAAAGRAAGLLARRDAADRAAARAEVAYAQRAEQFRALKKDLRALASTLQLDVQTVEAARRKQREVEQRTAEDLVSAAASLASRLSKLDVIAGRLSK